MIKTLLENWIAVLFIMGGVVFVLASVFALLILWKKIGGGDIKVGPLDIDVDGKE